MIDEQITTDIDQIVDSFFTTDACQCGSSEHESTNYPLCRLNIINTQPSVINTDNIRRCVCGSSTHQRTNHKDCKLNKRNVNNSLANTVQSLEDYIDLVNIDAEIPIEPNENVNTNQSNIDSNTAYSSIRIARQPFKEEFVCGPNTVTNKDSLDYARHQLAKRTKNCKFCLALMWDEEKLTSSTRNNFKFGFCCSNGKIQLPAPKELPNELLDILTKNTLESKQFRTSIRLYNSVLAFTSSSANVDESLMTATSGVYTYRINGAVHHKLSNYLPNEQYKPHFSQIYIYDLNMQTNIRTSMFPHIIKAAILNTFQGLLELNNPYVRIYMQAGKLIENNPNTQYNIVIKSDIKADRTKNAPTCNEIAVLMVDDDQVNTNKRDVIVKAKNSDTSKPYTFINENLVMYDPLAYPLLHLFGEPGWQYNMYPKKKKGIINLQHDVLQMPQFDDPSVNFSHENSDYLNFSTIETESNKFVTAREFYCYRLHDRKSIYFFFNS